MFDKVNKRVCAVRVFKKCFNQNIDALRADSKIKRKTFGQEHRDQQMFINYHFGHTLTDNYEEISLVSQSSACPELIRPCSMPGWNSSMYFTNLSKVIQLKLELKEHLTIET